MSTLILRTAAKLLIPLCLLVACVIYYKGHQSPGGGFVAGLTAAVALIVQGMAFGRIQWIWRREFIFIATGLLLALGTGIASLLFGLPFLRSAHGAVAGIELASAMVFDLGVMLVVMGVVSGMIHALTEELE